LIDSRSVLAVLSGLEERVETLFATIGARWILTRADQIRQLLRGEPHEKWIRARKGEYAKCFARWAVDPGEALCRFCGVIGIYVDVAAEAIAAYPDSFRHPNVWALSKHAEGLDVVYWLTNRRAPGGLDASIEALERSILETLSTRVPENVVAALRRSVFPVAPAQFASHELHLSRAYGRLRAKWPTEDILYILENDSEARQVAAMEMFDLDRVRRRFSGGPIWSPELERASENALAVREESIMLLREKIPTLEEQVTARDLLVFANSRIDAGFGFRGWPGMILSCLRVAATEE
jgi:hypothetical protein